LSRRLRIHAAAAEEAIEAAAWYETERAGLGAEFAQALDAAFDLLEENIVPLTSMRGAAAAHNVKRLMLRRFPYALIVLERGDELIVLAIAHQARRPGYWRDRLRS
jgi:toxin ParE1/3/4